MFNLVINLIHQRIPIGQLIATFLKVWTLGYILQKHGMDIERVVGTYEGDDALEVVVLAPLLDGILKAFCCLPLTFYEVALLTPEGTSGHGAEVGGDRGGTRAWGPRDEQWSR